MSNPMIQLAKVSPPFFKTALTKESSSVAAENGGALMSDAMILPCGHTFGAGGIEQVKQMERRSFGDTAYTNRSRNRTNHFPFVVADRVIIKEGSNFTKAVLNMSKHLSLNSLGKR
ncbi:hypothetical protein F2Q70_00029804 [Brassica cretica]|uniref:Uncharacterized protein n=1 Tax=Brassica cretica TaxID=69181 RepID=A0A8S9FEX5_BRACR|nr:hypothetical protein F2Q70_00029804 [Brassica cretica]